MIFISAFHSQEDASSGTYEKGAPWTSVGVGHMEKLDTSAVRVLEATAESNSYSFSKEPMLELSKTTSNSRSTEQKHTRTARDAVCYHLRFSAEPNTWSHVRIVLPQGEAHPATYNSGGVTGEGKCHRELTDII